MKKKILKIILFMVIVLLILSIGVLIFINERDKTIDLIDDFKQIEYGQIYNPSVDELIDLNKYSFIDKSKVIIEFEDEKDYSKVGDYIIKVKYKKLVLIQNVKVVDTIAPEISIDEKIEIDQDTDLTKYDFVSHAKVSDLSETKELKIDYSNVDSTKPGEYIAKVSVEDIYDNYSEKEFKVSILEVIKQEELEEQAEVKKETTKNTSKTVTTNTKTSSNNKTNSKQESSSKNTTITTSKPSNTSSNESQKIVETPSSNNTPTESKQNTNKNNNTSKKDNSNYCVYGGPEHVEGDGKNEHGYYKTWDAAWEACQVYMKGKGTGNFKVGECWCGLFYFWVE